MSAKKSLRLAALLLAAWRLIAQGPLVYDWNCTPNDNYTSGCYDSAYTTVGIVRSSMTATCTNDKSLSVSADAWATGCAVPVYLTATTTKYSDTIASDSSCSACSPDYGEVWACASQSSTISGGCRTAC